MSPRIKYTLFTLFVLAASVVTSLPSSAHAAPAERRIVFSTKSKQAADYARQCVIAIESFQNLPVLQDLARKCVEADPEFAFGQYFIATFSQTPEELKKNNERVVELVKNASDPERRYIEAVMLVRAGETDKALASFIELAKQFPDERMVQMMLGQIYTNQGKFADARTCFERAIALDPSTPRAYTFLGNIELLEAKYDRAREYYKKSMDRRAPNTAPFGPYTGLAWSYVYEGKYDEGIKILEAFRDDYVRTGGSTVFPEVFIWNSIARLHLESGRPEIAIKEYEAGYATVPGSTLDDPQKTIWLGRLHHGKGRALSRMGKRDDAWKEADTIKTMIENGGEAGKQFWPSYHYIAGYLKYQDGDYTAAVEEMKQTDLTDPFHMLILARAYEKLGDSENAQKWYKAIVDSTAMNIERALSYPEARRKLKA